MLPFNKYVQNFTAAFLKVMLKKKPTNDYAIGLGHLFMSD